MAAEKTSTAPTATESGVKSRLMPLIIVALLMAGEGIGVFFLAKTISPNPAPALAGGTEPGHPGDQLGEDELAEVELAECRPSNKMAGKFVMFHIRVSALVAVKDYDRAKALARAKRDSLEDGVNAVIRSAEPKHFNEPRYETIKRRLKQEFDRIFGDDQLVKKVLIPQLLQSGPGV